VTEIRYVVLNEHTLGMIREGMPQWLEPLVARNGGYDPKKGLAVISPRDTVRDATRDDFRYFQVDPTGHLE
jgi:hypothetical protein